MYFSIALNLSSCLLLQIKTYDKLILDLLLIDTASTLLRSSVYSIFLICADSFFLFKCNPDQSTLILIIITFISALTFNLATDKYYTKIFSIYPLIFISFLANCFEYRIESSYFLIGAIFSLPRRGFPCKPQKLTFENWKSIIYIIIQFVLNFYTLYYSMTHHALTLMADALSSLANNIAFVGAIVSDVATRMNNTKTFSFGFVSCKPVTDLSAAILQSIVLFRIFIDTINAFIEEDEITGNDNDPMLLVLSILGLVVTALGVFFVGGNDDDKNNEKEQKSKCSFDSETLMVLCDLFGSIAVVTSSFLISVFNMKFIDPYVSLFNAVMVSIVTYPSIKDAATILCLKSPFSPDYAKFSQETNLEISGMHYPISDKDNVMEVKVIGKSTPRIIKAIKKFAKLHKVRYLTIERIQ
ncbi:cation efflux family protein [Trichomonas vaginalis G3]|uniref:Cation efflux family protein n=1 Tax=Trichomonas vaginalis (strain ATCC PRA-98 / G3) TaxID=412133 RepID=A2ECG5_TRIV3|nr:regulation of sequestering of zinc ion [Trichomonas vaginalis G3]EAY09660.1 cation efflux family protein [Trichomonas vaginalis G3]KAI5528662.1 regulation of sequestering of zinc ion [Trichomonas vaginalis G3]|eukprot:XP_001321883.1 cation efflux family protein [Trichomonas vaginalis G3]